MWLLTISNASAVSLIITQHGLELHTICGGSSINKCPVLYRLSMFSVHGQGLRRFPIELCYSMPNQTAGPKCSRRTLYTITCTIYWDCQILRIAFKKFCLTSCPRQLSFHVPMPVGRIRS
ncbi:hypothetical protein POM88_018551 [Heracleum sosnowskyi]|uniref:Uncharacterized protein n=1 Tax=Heracleum sosnowskyi TaxID=360622 RepID=A0AAD8ISR8_9APIA|nr:hypothetical protein POM88_018551 [Heracleum sosnowskyi]